MPEIKLFKRPVFILISLLGLIAVYLFQRNLAGFASNLGNSAFTTMAVVTVARFVINDLLMILLIYGVFKKKKYVVFAFYVQLAGIVFILSPYLILRYLEVFNTILLSFLHRLVVNPLLMIMLIPPFYYQRLIEIKNKNKHA
ncbi:hypothetical protein GCM10009122_56190 [Fulvivirga kasyanovii]|uniref:Exosortase F system-associated protein n=1 Tax=Fulvivirga kasyanovii TaxID=396812 RepID=A0ABW9RLF4_9BACT|nr:exosortase F system-associated protein [Fulvivirga kasyanovii]MTI24657.1 exosortase F system-associated protein [Fulvivirga kasyanovii]